MTKFNHIEDFDVADKVVILRTDFNVPIVKGKITDKARISRSMATIKYLIHHKAKVIILSHFGRPKGKFNPDMSLAPIVDVISEYLNGKEIHFSYDILANSTKKQIEAMKGGDVLIAENVRFHPEEEQNDREFAKKIATLGDYYINDAFSCSHRKNATIEAIANFLPAAIGFLHEEEITSLTSILENAENIFAMSGGAKISSKIGLLKSLVSKVDHLVIGGAMANTFLKAQGFNIGNSVYEEKHLGTAKDIIALAESHECQLILPTDVVTAKEMNDEVRDSRVIDIGAVKDDEMILDVGPQTIINIIEKLKLCHTVIWNGPLGAFEYRPFDIGTTAISRAISKLTIEKKLISVAGGGDVVAAITEAGLEQNFTYISTGGGAFLAWLEGREMPGINALMSNYARAHLSD